MGASLDITTCAARRVPVTTRNHLRCCLAATLPRQGLPPVSPLPLRQTSGAGSISPRLHAESSRRHHDTTCPLPASAPPDQPLPDVRGCIRTCGHCLTSRTLVAGAGSGQPPTSPSHPAESSPTPGHLLGRCPPHPLESARNRISRRFPSSNCLARTWVIENLAEPTRGPHTARPLARPPRPYRDCLQD